VAFTAKHELNEGLIEIRRRERLKVGLTPANGVDMIAARAMAALTGDIGNHGGGVELAGTSVRDQGGMTGEAHPQFIPGEPPSVRHDIRVD
jgi:hypothetical protein